MPGIVGLITKMPREWAEARLLRMVESVRHESFYLAGTWIDESLGVYVGWTVQSNGFSEAMPLRNEVGDIFVVFSGEEFPAQGTAQQLRGRGHVFEGEGRAYLVHLYEEDPKFPVGLNGMFHGLIGDRTRETAMLFNDRYGMHRICYHESEGVFYFAAEAKAILSVCPELRVGDPKSLGEVVACSCVLEDRTIFRGISLLPAGSAWVFRGGSIERKNTYFRPREWEEQAQLEPEAYCLELQNVFSQNFPLYFTGRGRIGMTLTGGIDTRMIMAWCTPPLGSLPCYTFGGMYRDCQDVRVARQVARLCQQSHQVIRVGEEFLSDFPRYAERSVYLSEGGVDVYRSSDLYVSERAREIAPVKVVGTYGSEILRHAAMFRPVAPPPGLFRPDFLAYVQQAQVAYAKTRREHPVTFAAFRQSPWYHHGVLSLERSQLTVRSPFLDNRFVQTVFRAPRFSEASDDIRLRLIKDGSASLAKIPTDRGIGGAGGPVLGFIRHALLEFTFKAEYAYDYGMPQWLCKLDHLLSSARLERLFLGRHKLTHFRVWYRDQLAEYVREILLDSRTLARPYLDHRTVERIVLGHVRGKQNYTTAIHKLLTLELMHRLFFDPQ